MSRVNLLPGNNLDAQGQAEITAQVNRVISPAEAAMKQDLLNELNTIIGSTAVNRGNVLLGLAAGFELNDTLRTARNRAMTNTGIPGTMVNDRNIMQRAVTEDAAVLAQTEWRTNVQPYFETQMNLYNAEQTNIRRHLVHIRTLLTDLNSIVGLEVAMQGGGIVNILPLDPTLAPLAGATAPINSLIDANPFTVDPARTNLNDLEDLSNNADRGHAINGGRANDLYRIITNLRTVSRDLSGAITLRNTHYQNIMGEPFLEANIVTTPLRYDPTRAVPRLYGSVETHLNHILPPEHPSRIEIENAGAAFILHVHNRPGVRVAGAEVPAGSPGEIAFQEWLLTHEPAPAQQVVAQQYLRTRNANITTVNTNAQAQVNTATPGNIISDLIASGFVGDAAKINEYARAFMTDGTVANSVLFAAGGIPNAATNNNDRLYYAAALSGADRTDNIATTQTNAVDGMNNLLTTALTDLRNQLQVVGGVLRRIDPAAIPPIDRPSNATERCAFMQMAARDRTSLTAPQQGHATLRANRMYTTLTPQITAAVAAMGARNINEQADATARATAIMAGLGAGVAPLNHTTQIFDLAYHYNIPGTSIQGIEDLVRDAIRTDILGRLPGPALTDTAALIAAETRTGDAYADHLGRYVPNMINAFQGASTRNEVELTRAQHIIARARLTSGQVVNEMNTRNTAGTPLNLNTVNDRVTIANLIVDNVLQQRTALMTKTRTAFDNYQVRRGWMNYDVDAHLARNRGRYVLGTLGIGAAGLISAAAAPALATGFAVAFGLASGGLAWRTAAAGARRAFDFFGMRTDRAMQAPAPAPTFGDQARQTGNRIGRSFNPLRWSMFRSGRNRTNERLRGVQDAVDPNQYNQATAVNPVQFNQHMAYHLAKSTKSTDRDNAETLGYLTPAMENADRARMTQETLTLITTALAGPAPVPSQEQILENVITEVITNRENELIARVEEEKRAQRRTNIYSEAIGAAAGFYSFHGAFNMMSNAQAGIMNWMHPNPTSTPAGVPHPQGTNTGTTAPQGPNNSTVPTGTEGTITPPVGPDQWQLPSGQHATLTIPNVDGSSITSKLMDTNGLGLNQNQIDELSARGVFRQFLGENNILQGGQQSIYHSGLIDGPVSGINLVYKNQQLIADSLVNSDIIRQHCLSKGISLDQLLNLLKK